MPHRYEILKTEIETDPLGRGYSAMSDQEVADDINTNVRPSVDIETVSSGEIYEIIDRAEEAAEITDPADQAELSTILSLGSVKVGAGSKAAGFIRNRFGAGPTRTAFNALVGKEVLRWQEIGLPRPVKVGHVEDVRR